MKHFSALQRLSVRGTSRGVVLTVVLNALMVAVIAGSPAMAAAAPLYPDLRMLSPTDLGLTTADVNGQEHHVIYFDTRVANLGEGAVEVQRTPTASGIADLKQRIYESPAGFRDEVLGAVAFDPMEWSFPVPDIARYEVWSQRAFARAQARSFQRGQPLFVHDSVGHCVLDWEQLDPNAVDAAKYPLCTRLVSGISVGWADREFANEVDVGAAIPPDGDYVLRVIVDPTNLLFESAGKADPARESESANSAVTYFRLSGGQLAGLE
jgi:hypothetical protein